jgi:hypothetical protein
VLDLSVEALNMHVRQRGVQFRLDPRPEFAWTANQELVERHAIGCFEQPLACVADVIVNVLLNAALEARLRPSPLIVLPVNVI